MENEIQLFVPSDITKQSLMELTQDVQSAIDIILDLLLVDNIGEIYYYLSLIKKHCVLRGVNIYLLYKECKETLAYFKFALRHFDNDVITDIIKNKTFDEHFKTVSVKKEKLNIVSNL